MPVDFADGARFPGFGQAPLPLQILAAAIGFGIVPGV